MTVKIMNFVSEEESPEKLVGLFLLNEDGEELSKLSFYVKEDHSRIEPELFKSLEKLPIFLKDIYTFGRNGTPVEFSIEDIQISSDN